MYPFLVLCLAGSVPESVFENPTAWQPDEVDGVLTVEKRPIESSPLFEYRVTAVSEAPMQLLCDTVFEWGTKGEKGPTVVMKKLLKDGETERVVYSQLEPPLISRRDYTMTVRRLPAEASACRIRFKITNDEGPASTSSVVRMEKMWGGWTFEPASEGKTKLTYVLFADPGGSVPNFLVHGGQKKGAKDSVLIALDKGRAAVKGGK